MVKIWEAVGEFNDRSLLGKIVVNPPQLKSEIKPRKLEDEWFICSCGKGYSNFQTYQKHKIDHENNTIELKPTWSYPKFNSNNIKDSQQQVKVKSNNNNNKKTKNESQNGLNNGKANFVSKLKIATPSIKCKICHRFFYFVGRLRQHVDAQHPEEAKNFVVPKINKKKQKAIIKATSKKLTGSLHLQKVNKIKKILNNLPKTSETLSSSSKKDLELTNNTTKNKISKTNNNKPSSKVLKHSTAKTLSKNITSGNNIKLPITKDKNVPNNLLPCPHCKKSNYVYSEICLRNHIELKHFDKVSISERIIPAVATNSQTISASSSLPSEQQIKEVRKRRKRKFLTLQGHKIARKSALNSLANQSQTDDDVNNPLPPVLTPIDKKVPRKSTKRDNNTSATTTSIKGTTKEQVSKNTGIFFYDAIGTRTRSKNMDEDISPPTLDLMEDNNYKLGDDSIQSNKNNNLSNVSKSPYSKNKIQTMEKKQPKQNSSEELPCTFCVHKFPSETALQLHLKHHQVLGVYNKMKANNNNNNNKINNGNNKSLVGHRGRQNSVKSTNKVVKNSINKNPVKLITNDSTKLGAKMKNKLLSPPRLSPAPGSTKSPINNSPSKNQSPNSSLSCHQTTESNNNNIKSAGKFRGNFPCKLCPKVLTEDRYLKVHMLAHSKFKCSMCSKVFTFKRHLEKHKKTVHHDSKIENQTIPSKDTSFVTQEESLNSSITLESVIGQRTKRAKKLLQEVQTSTIVVATTSNSEEKQKHQQQRDNLVKAGNLVTCSTCNVRISKYMLHHHHKIAHSTQIEYKCEECTSTRSFESFRALASHKRCSHKVNESQSPTRPLPEEKSKQPACLRMRIERKRNGRLKTNLFIPDTINNTNNNNTGTSLQESHKVQETMKCDLCKFDIPAAVEGVLLHKQVAHVKNGDFQCHMCSCRYRTKTGLASHLRNKTHTEENIKTAANRQGATNQIEDKKLSPSTSSMKSKPDITIFSTSSSSLSDVVTKPSPSILQVKDEEGIKFQKDAMTVPKIVCYYSQNPEFLRTQNSPQKNNNLNIKSSNNNINSQNSRPHSSTITSNINNSGEQVKYSSSHWGIKDRSVTITPINNFLNNTLRTPPRTEKVSTNNNFTSRVSNLSPKNTNKNNSLTGRNLDFQSIVKSFQRVSASYKQPAILKKPSILKQQPAILKQQPLATVGTVINKFRSSYPAPSLAAQQQPKPTLPQVVTCSICQKTFFSEKRLSVHIQEHMVADQSKQIKNEKCGYCGHQYSRDDILTHLQHCRGVNSPNKSPNKNESLK